MDPSTVDTVIYHHPCSDGQGAGWCAWKLLGSRARYIPAVHGEPPPDVKGRRVVLLDFAYDRETTVKMIEDAEELRILDHHKSALKNLDGIREATIDLSHSGAMLGWNFFHPGKKPPKFLQYIEDRDLWKFELEYSREFSTAFSLVPFEFEAYNQFLYDSTIDDAKRRGAHLLPYVEMNVAKACEAAARRKLGDYSVLVVNSTHWVSEIGERLARAADVGLVWKYDHHLHRIICSLRSQSEDVDCSVIAKRFGGGGHPGAAGFQITDPIESIFT